MPSPIATTRHEWVGAATVSLDIRQARRANLRGSYRAPKQTRIDVLEIYCAQCRRPYNDVVDAETGQIEPCIAATTTEHLRGGPIGVRKKRKHDNHNCLLLGCDIAEPDDDLIEPDVAAGLTAAGH